MGARNFTAGLVLLVVILNNVHVLEALPNGNSDPGLQGKIFPDFRQMHDPEANPIFKAYDVCTRKWYATIGDSCISPNDSMSKFRGLAEKGAVPACELKKIFEHRCQEKLECSGGCCECKGSSVDSSACNDSSIPEKDLTQNCDKEIQMFLRLVDMASSVNVTCGKSETLTCSRNTRKNVTSRNIVSSVTSVSDPGQNYQYINLMAVIFFFVAAN